LIIGVEDDGTITGMNDFTDSELDSIKRAPQTNVHSDTPLQSVLFRAVTIDKLKVAYFRIPKGTQCIHLTSDGRCLRRNDLETIPVPPEQIQFSRREVVSREYDREFVDNVSVADLDRDLLKITAEQIASNISVDSCLQYLGLAEFDANLGLRLRRAAVLLFAKLSDKWHPRVQVRILKVDGTSLGSGAAYNIKSDVTVKTNVIRLIDEAWDNLRPHLVTTRFAEDARFRTTHIYPEIACREALTNAIAHRDYSEEGSGIEIYIYDDRIEIHNPGSLLSTMSLVEIKSLQGVHQSRNSYIARTLREIGVMRELGEGMRRIFELMKTNELAPPEIKVSQNSFVLSLHHRPMYSKDESLWLGQYDIYSLTREEKAVMLMGRRGDLIAPNEIIRRLGIVDIEHYRQIVHSLQQKRLFESAITKDKATRDAKKKGLSIRDFPRFKIKQPRELGQTTHSPREQVSGPSAIKHSRAMEKELESVVDTISNEAAESDLKLYVGNLPPNTTRRDVLAAFVNFGAPVDIVIPMRHNLTRGFAFVEFSDPQTTNTVLDAKINIGGRHLTIRRKSPRPSP
jgi:ATP-dependent DNA helicase RecG